MTEHFCTYFDSRYLHFGLALYQSLCKHHPNSKLWVLVLDEVTCTRLKYLQLDNIELIELKNLESTKLREARGNRNYREYIWTLTPFLPDYIFSIEPNLERITYLDSDVIIRHSLEPLFEKIECVSASVLITEHDAAQEYDYSHILGRYCVQLLVLKRSGIDILSFWQNCVLDRCSQDWKGGVFGDQGYLDQWPALFGDRVYVLRPARLAMGPWGALKHAHIDPIIWHFHGLRYLGLGRFLLSSGYELPRSVIRLIYEPYIRSLITIIYDHELESFAAQEVNIHCLRAQITFANLRKLVSGNKMKSLAPHVYVSNSLHLDQPDSHSIEQTQLARILPSNQEDLQCLITSDITWPPYKILIYEFLKSKTGSNRFEHLIITNLGLNSVSQTKHCTGWLPSPWLFAFRLTIESVKMFCKVLCLVVYFKDSKCLRRISINGIVVGDIVAAEYLRDSAFGNGVLNIDSRFLLVSLKYVVVYCSTRISLRKLLLRYEPRHIAFSLQETSFKDELRRRYLISQGIRTEIAYNKILGRMQYYFLPEGFMGSFYEHTSRLVGNLEEHRSKVFQAFEQRFNTGSEIWSKNPTDINVGFSLDASKQVLDSDLSTVLLCLHAVADDQYRCGFDDFKSLDDFHRFTISYCLELGCRVLIKAHPGIRSTIHTDKAKIDHRYVTSLFQDYGLDYTEVLSSDPSRLHHSAKDSHIYATHPQLSLKEIRKTFPCLVVSHHGSIVIEACHLGMPTVKYRFCKNRLFDYCHSWSTRDEYKMLLKYFSLFKKLPSRTFRDTYLDVSVSLASKSSKPDYNKIISSVYSQYTAEVPFTGLTKRADIFDQVAKIYRLYWDDSVFEKLVSSALTGLMPEQESLLNQDKDVLL